MPEPDFPKAESVEEVLLAGDRYILPGTLELPDMTGPVACAVFFAGSGPTDRDWSSPLSRGAGGGKLLAATLRRRGIGSLRFDKLGSGRNRRGLGRLSLDHFRDEGVLAFEYLDDLPACRVVFLLGISEGAIHALRTAAAKGDDPVLGGVIMLAPPAKPLIDRLLDQIWANELGRGDPDRTELAQLLSDFRYAARDGDDPTPPDFGGLEPLVGLWRSLNHPVNARVARQLLFVDPLPAAGDYSGDVLILSDGGPAGEAAARIAAAIGRGGSIQRREVIEGARADFVRDGELVAGVQSAISAFIDAVMSNRPD